MIHPRHIGLKASRNLVLASVLLAGLVQPGYAIDPPYQPQMQRLAEIMGSLYFLQPLCGTESADWRAEMGELISLDEPDDDRRQRLAGAFNTGYTAFARLYRSCTPSATTAIGRLLLEAEKIAREIHSRYAE